MTMLLKTTLVGALALGTASLLPTAGFAGQASHGSSLLVPVSNSAWAARAQGKDSIYGPTYGYNFGTRYGAEPAWGYEGGYAGPAPYGADVGPYGVGPYDDDY